MNRKTMLRRLARGHLQNVVSADFVHLLKGFGLELLRVSGSHHIFGHPDIPEEKD